MEYLFVAEHDPRSGDPWNVDVSSDNQKVLSFYLCQGNRYHGLEMNGSGHDMDEEGTE